MPVMQSGRLLLVIAPARIAKDLTTDVTSRLAMLGFVDIIDGGNRLEVYSIARAIRRQTKDLVATLKRIRLTRAFTCYQLLALLAQSPTTPSPRIVLDILSTFYDEGVTVSEAYRLLQESVKHLHRLSRSASVIVFAQPSPFTQPERALFLEHLQDIAENVLVFKPNETELPQRLL